MKLWLLSPRVDIEGEDPWKPWYDKAFGFVIRAESEERARQIANDNGGDETGAISQSVYRTGGDPWLDKKYSICEELTSDGSEEMIIRDFASA